MIWYRCALIAFATTGLLLSAGSPAYVLTTFNAELSTYQTKSGLQTGLAASGADAQSFALSSDGQKAYAASLRTGSIHVIDLHTNRTTATLVGAKEPVSVVLSKDDSRLYVLDSSAKVLDVFDTASGALTASIAIKDSHFSSVALQPDGSAVYVAAAGGVTVVDPVTDTIVATIPVSDAIRMAFSPSGGRLFVTSQSYHPNIAVIDTNTNSILTTISMGDVAGLNGIAVSPDGETVYAVNALGLSAISTSTYAVTGMASGHDVVTIVVTPDGKAGFSIANNGTQLIKWDLVKLSSAETTDLNGTASAFLFSPNAALYFVLYESYNLLSVVDTDNSQVIHRINGTPGVASFGALSASANGKAIVTDAGQVSTNSNSVNVIDRASGRITQSVTLSPLSYNTAVAVNSDASLAFVPVGNAQPSIGIVDLVAGKLSQTITLPGFGENQEAFVQISPDDQTLFVVFGAPPQAGNTQIQLCRVDIPSDAVQMCVPIASAENVDLESLVHVFVLNENGTKLYVPIDKAVLGEYDAKSLSLLRTVSIPLSGVPYFSSICISAVDNSLFTAYFDGLDDQNFVYSVPLDSFDNPLQSPAQGPILDLAVTADGKKLYVAESSLVVLNAQTLEPLAFTLPQQLSYTLVIPVN